MKTLNEKEEYLLRRNSWIRQEFEANMAMLPDFEIHEIVWFLANKYNLTLAEIETIVDNQ